VFDCDGFSGAAMSTTTFSVPELAKLAHLSLNAQEVKDISRELEQLCVHLDNLPTLKPAQTEAKTSTQPTQKHRTPT